MAFPRHDVEIVVQHNEFQKTLMSRGWIVGQAVAKVAVTAFRIRMARFLLDLFTGHYEFRIAEAGHPLPVRVAQDTLITRLIT